MVGREGAAILLRRDAGGCSDYLTVWQPDESLTCGHWGLVHSAAHRSLGRWLVLGACQGVEHVLLLRCLGLCGLNHLSAGLSVLADKYLLLVVRLAIAREASAARLATRRNGMIAQVIQRVLVRTLIPIKSSNVVSWSPHQIIRGSHRCIARISGRYADHSVYVLLDVFHKALDHVDLPWAIQNEAFNCMVDLLLVLANAAHLQELFLVCPLNGLRVLVRCVLLRRVSIVEGRGVRQAALRRLVHVHV